MTGGGGVSERWGMRKIECEFEARAALLAAAGSGLGRREWARSQGIDGRSLHAWARNLTQRTGGETPFVQVIPDAPQVPAVGAMYTVVVGELRLEIGPQFDEGAVTRLVRALRAC